MNNEIISLVNDYIAVFKFAKMIHDNIVDVKDVLPILRKAKLNSDARLYLKRALSELKECINIIEKILNEGERNEGG
ncbi:hypothetical protein DRO97_02760 [Archaeoglobales archaeon]|nr:MAG: hypothetical protein DRO97_02760 [Archaeoglobales archaeon]